MSRTLIWAGLVAGLSAIGLAGCDADYGGNVLERDEAIVNRIALGEFKELPRDCRSACTMELGMYRQGLICVHADARFYFHGTMRRQDGRLIPIYGDMKDRYDEMVGRHYPPNLKRWWDETGRWAIGLTNFEVLTGQQIHDMDGGLVPLCE